MIPLLQIKNLTVDFPGTESSRPALDNFSMELYSGEMLAVVGESGSGKSVMALSLMNLLSPAARIVQGSAIFSPDGRESVDLLRLPEKKIRALRGNKMAMIFQEPMTSLNPVMTCGDQLMEPLRLHKKLSRAEARKSACRLFEKVLLADPERIYKAFPHQLSGGQKQRVMIAMAISCNPSLLICDEPTTALDVRVQHSILHLLKDLRRSEQMGMLFITHDLGLVKEMADKAIVMLEGKVVEAAAVQSLFESPHQPYTKGLLMCRPGLHKKGERLPVVADFTSKEKSAVPVKIENPFSVEKPREKIRATINFPLAGKPEKNPAPVSTPDPEILVQVKDLHLRYSTGKTWLGREKQWVDAIREVQFDIYRGETLGLVGESGSGKTTLGRALLGLNKPYRGSIAYGGTELLSLNPEELHDFRRQVQIVFQDPYSSLNPRLMAGPAIEEPLKVHESQNPRNRKEQVMDWLQKVDLKKEHYYRYPHAFSGGQRQRIVIARALALHPGFVVFDESVSALDTSVQAQVLNLINDLKNTLGFTALFISHDLSVIRYLCDRVLVMEKGRIVESGDVESVYQNPQTAYTRSLIAAIPGI